MAKKVRKPRSISPRTYSGARPSSTPAPAPTPVEKRVQPKRATPPVDARQPDRPASVAPKASKVDFAAEYRYVAGDLRRMLMLAGVMLVVLIALNFVLN